MFSKILIANRGEIACRVMKTARRMGIATVAVYSDADRDAMHVAMADEAVHIGAAPATESYLNSEKIIAAAKQTGAEAVHPGYGFLSENADFARALEAANITFIGPDATAIEKMGDKITAKNLAQKAGVNTIPGHDSVIADATEAMQIAEQIGYPVMLKASAGGGGKGMRIAHNKNEVQSGFARAASEAAASFGDDRILLEKFIAQPRHIEIQIIADKHGNAVFLGERECSIQRRHQKVIEEAPSPFIDATTRAAMGAQALALGKAVGYDSAGTVEMVVDDARNFYFLEMNTRLQVEHPVTEMITGVDLVEMMLRVAAGEKLSIAQADVRLDGWAMETRVYAENPRQNFVPSSGRLTDYLPPPEENDANTGKNLTRVDAGVDAGAEISRFYDPMIAKLVTWGENRATAIARMRTALNQYHIRGVDTNLSFAASVMAHHRFQSGDLNTDFISDEYPDGFSAARASELAAEQLGAMVAVLACVHHRLHRRLHGRASQLPDDGRGREAHWVAIIDDESHAVTVREREGALLAQYAGAEYCVVEKWQPPRPVFQCSVNGVTMHMQFERCGYGYKLTHDGVCIEAVVLTPRAAELREMMPVKTPPDLSRFLLSPMPGLLAALHIEAGARVKAGQELAIIEAMKMENSVCAERDGVVEKVLARPGTTVAAEQPILEFAAATANQTE